MFGIWRFPKMGVQYPQINNFKRMLHCKPSILWYPHIVANLKSIPCIYIYYHINGVLHSSFCHSRVGCTSNPNEILSAVNHIITQIDREKVWLVEHFQKPQLVIFSGTLLPLISLNVLGMIISHEASVPMKSNHSIILLGMSKRFPLVAYMILIDYPIISHSLPMLFEDFLA